VLTFLVFFWILLESLPVFLKALDLGLCFLTYIHIYINDTCNVITYSNFFLFADGINIFRVVKSFDNSTQLQLDIDSVQGWCTANCMNLSISKLETLPSAGRPFF
jgi:hypothetical protein